MRCIQFAFLCNAIHMAREHRQNAIQCLNKNFYIANGLYQHASLQT